MASSGMHRNQRTRHLFSNFLKGKFSLLSDIGSDFCVCCFFSYVPDELVPEIRTAHGLAGNAQVQINLVDKRQEEFVPPKPKFSFENSVGQSLGGSVASRHRAP